MSGKRKHPPPGSPRPGAAAPRTRPEVGRPALHFSGQMVRMEHLPPEILARFNEVIPGSARELLDSTLAETLHRRKLEENTIAARNASVAYRDKSAFRSDILGQCLGFIWNMSCLATAATLAWFKPDMWKVAVAMAAMPAFTVGVKVIIDSRHLRKAKPGDAPH